MKNPRACPTSIPWDDIEPHRDVLEKYYGRKLEAIAKQGGMDPLELMSVIIPDRVDGKNPKENMERATVELLMMLLARRKNEI